LIITTKVGEENIEVVQDDFRGRIASDFFSVFISTLKEKEQKQAFQKLEEQNKQLQDQLDEQGRDFKELKKIQEKQVEGQQETQDAALVEATIAFYRDLDSLLSKVTPEEALCTFDFGKIKRIIIRENFLSAKFNDKLWSNLESCTTLGQVVTVLRQNLKVLMLVDRSNLLQNLKSAGIKTAEGISSLPSFLITLMLNECKTPISQYKAWLSKMLEETRKKMTELGKQTITWAKFKEETMFLQQIFQDQPPITKIIKEWENGAKSSQGKNSDTASVEKIKLYQILKKILEDHLNQDQQNNLNPDEMKKLPSYYPFILAQNQDVKQVTINNYHANNTKEPTSKPADKTILCTVKFESDRFQFGLKNELGLFCENLILDETKTSIWSVNSIKCEQFFQTGLTSITPTKAMVKPISSKPKTFVSIESKQEGWYKFLVTVDLILQFPARKITRQDILAEIANLDTGINVLNTGAGLAGGVLLTAPNPISLLIFGEVALAYYYHLNTMADKKSKLDQIKDIEVPSGEIPVSYSFEIHTGVAKGIDSKNTKNTLLEQVYNIPRASPKLAVDFKNDPVAEEIFNQLTKLLKASVIYRRETFANWTSGYEW
jgi:hypothetical protein